MSQPIESGFFKKQNKVSLSVIIPVFNVAPYLQRCIDSIREQSFSNLEIILVDDGSTDNSLNICYEYAKKDSRIQVIQQVNGGSSIARNAGLKIATGNHIAFIDSDDWIHKDMFNFMMDYLIEHDLPVVECGIMASRTLKSLGKPTISGNKHIETKEEAMERIIQNNSFSVWRRIYRKDVVSSFSFIPGKIHQDVFFTIDVINKIDRQGYISSPLYIYNNENESVIRSPYNEQKLAAKDALYYVVEQTLQYNNKVKLYAKQHLLEGLIAHYNSLFFYSEIDKDKTHRKKLKKEITEQVNIKNNIYSPYSILAKYLPLNLYGCFLKVNEWRIKIKLKLLRR
ncbi:glycosyltransferase [Zobellia galactanivorans]|uniref:glycosyltransferase n=1 Tax=Zobellia galactanivorans (strain DSM 12802 / CCUG 47099 / CIP 106680 / NCIMB 13871 / Dsij) TaxID=63186 RepID=UPI001C06FF60|nr:glycosyltransferase [Zobellia galactanivorans]MBU3024417.1 glycosyltransferase [Zobellia galactanivorans]